ncbi:MAG: hypothetical protein WC549_02065 [Actinomycetota bacterium]
MKIRESNLIEICKKHGVVYHIIISDHTKPARQSLVPCRCDQYDSSYEAKQNNYECKVKNCGNDKQCIFHKKCETDVQKNRRPILFGFHKNGKKMYGCVNYNWNGEMNETE